MGEVMICSRCGKDIRFTPDAYGQVVTCPECGQAASIPPMSAQEPGEEGDYEGPRLDPPSISNLLIAAFFLPIFGVVAIAFAAQVTGRVASRDYGAANTVARRARAWCLIAFVPGAFLALIEILLWVA